MTITAKYSGRCTKCGQRIAVGDLINWVRGEGASHVECPCQQLAEQMATHGDGKTYHLSKGSGYSGAGWTEGDIVQNSKLSISQGEPDFLCVLSAFSRYISEDGMSFGVGDESGYIFHATCREATAEEAAPLKEQLAKREQAKAVKARLSEIKQQITTDGDLPEYHENNAKGGTVLLDSRTAYGGGAWFVITDEAIWYVLNNGADGDDWGRNNVRTGGAGAIGWKIPLNKELATELQKIHELLGK